MRFGEAKLATGARVVEGGVSGGGGEAGSRHLRGKSHQYTRWPSPGTARFAATICDLADSAV